MTPTQAALLGRLLKDRFRNGEKKRRREVSFIELKACWGTSVQVSVVLTDLTPKF